LRALKIAFFVCLAIWLGGALITMEYANPAKRLELIAFGASDHDVAMMNLRSISINLFGLLTIASGLFLTGAWLYKRSLSAKPSHPPADLHPTPEAPTSAIRSERPSSPHPIESERVSCSFSGWARNGNKIVQEYTYRGQGLNHRATVELTVERGAVNILRFVHIWIFPAIGHEGQGEVLLVDEASNESPGWLRSRIGTAAGNLTLLNIEAREGADAVWRLFSAGRDLEFAVRLDGEKLLSLPMPNNPGAQQHYDSILSSLRS
jgi:hypothetical protein